MSVLRTLVSSSRALLSGAKDVARFREITGVFVRHGFGWVFAQLKLRRELQVNYEGADLTRAALGSPDTGKRLVAALCELGPTFVKFGQILSTRADILPSSIISELVTLQDDVGQLPLEQVNQQLHRNLGNDYRSRFSSLDEHPLASASIAQVHRAQLQDGTDVVLKVQRPGVRRKIESDISIMLVLAGYIEESIEEARAMDLRGIIEGFAKSIFQELDFRLEAKNLEHFARNFDDNPKIVLPGVHHELSTAEILCMDFIDGRKFSAVIDAGEDITPLIDTYFGAAYKMLFHDGFFHGDLHPGNVFVLDEGRLALIDCGMVGRLSPSMQDKIIDILYAVMNEDLEAVARALYALAIPQGPVDYEAFEVDVMEIAERYLVGMPLSEIQIGALFSELVTGATKHSVRMPTDFTMMFKAIVTTEGLAKSLAPNVDPVELARPYVMDMIQQRYSPERIKQMALADLGMYQRMLRSLPRSLPSVLSDLRDGKLAFRLAPETLAEANQAADVRTRRLSRVALTVTCLACGTYTLGLNLPIWPLPGIPYVSAGFYFGAGVGLFSLWRR